jgi:dolichol-phosphate mannosyltransferase
VRRVPLPFVSWAGRIFRAGRYGAFAVLVGRLSRGRRRRPPVAAVDEPPRASVSVIVPARNEEGRLAGCLAPLAGDPDLLEVIVVDDESSDGTARVAEAHGATTLPGAPLPPGWAGKAWALEQGLRAARGELVLSLDADARPRAGLARAMAAARGDALLLSAGPRFVCHSAGERLLHPALLATLVYRFGPADVEGYQPSPARALANGQCMLVDRERLLAAGGLEQVRGQLTEDMALARALRRRGEPIAFVDATALLEVQMYEGARETWSGWGRSLAVADASEAPRLLADVAIVWLCQAAPLVRVLLGRAAALDWLLLSIRLAVHAALARSYARRGAPFWLAPLADVPAALRLSWSALRPSRSWRGRTYPPSGRTTARSAS